MLDVVANSGLGFPAGFLGAPREPGRGRGGTATELRRQCGVSLAGRHPSPRPRTAGGLRGAVAPPRQTGDARLSRPWSRAVRGDCGYLGRTHRLGERGYGSIATGGTGGDRTLLVFAGHSRMG
ncbi:MAG: hypothetical protein ACRDTD_10165 [Pseudonocardiaceae bacterium]